MGDTKNKEVGHRRKECYAQHLCCKASCSHPLLFFNLKFNQVVSLGIDYLSQSQIRPKEWREKCAVLQQFPPNALWSLQAAVSVHHSKKDICLTGTLRPICTADSTRTNPPF